MDGLEICFFKSKLINEIVSQETKFNYLVSQLKPKYSATKYSESKTWFLDLFKESESTRIKKKNTTVIDLGNLKPSQLLQKLKSGNRCVNSRHRI